MATVVEQTASADRAPGVVERIKALTPMIRALAERIDAERTIPRELADALWDAGVFRAQLPRTLGGLELHRQRPQ